MTSSAQLQPSLTEPSVLIDMIWSRRDTQLANMARLAVLVFAGTAIMAISSKIQVAMWPVPMTMQTFAVLVIAMSYGFRLGSVTLLAYLAEGAMGLPVFADGGGFAYLAGPTGGYLVGFFVAASLVGWLAEKGWDRNVVLTLAAMTIGTAIIFGLGVSWLAIFLGDFNKALASGLTPFLIGAAFKIALAAASLPVAWFLLSGRAR